MLHDSIRMRWLAQEEHPNFRTINRFRINSLMDSIGIGLSSISFLLKSGLITGEKLFIDGTKIEADANKYTFVWKKSISNYETAKKEYRKLIKQEIVAEMMQEMAGALTIEELHKIEQILQKKETCLAQTTKETPEVAKKRNFATKNLFIIKQSSIFQSINNEKSMWNLFSEQSKPTKVSHDSMYEVKKKFIERWALFFLCTILGSCAND